MRMNKPPIDGVLLTSLKKFSNPKGDLFHVMKKSDIGFIEFGEAYFTTVLSETTKGWYKHLRMTLNLVVPIGKVEFCIFDDRENSQTKESFYSVELSQDNYCRLTIPPNLWFAFKGKADEINLILDITNMKHDDSEKIRIALDEIPYNWT